MSRNFSNQNFGSDEEDDEDFNPVPAQESDHEEQVKVGSGEMKGIILGSDRSLNRATTTKKMLKRIRLR